jgi:hypothetical protein
LEDEDLSQRAVHFILRVSDPVGCHIFFGAQVVEIPIDPGYQIHRRKKRLAVAVAVDILRCPLINLAVRSPSENPERDMVSHKAKGESNVVY